MDTQNDPACLFQSSVCEDPVGVPLLKKTMRTVEPLAPETTPLLVNDAF